MHGRRRRPTASSQQPCSRTARAAAWGTHGCDLGDRRTDELDIALADPPAPRGARAPQGRSYATYAWFSDPDGSGWLLQEITERLPGWV
jgi:hypothetical protein